MLLEYELLGQKLKIQADDEFRTHGQTYMETEIDLDDYEHGRPFDGTTVFDITRLKPKLPPVELVDSYWTILLDIHYHKSLWLETILPQYSYNN